MSSVGVWMLTSLALALVGCASSYQVVQLPQREADLYPVSQTKSGVTVAIDEIRSPDRVERYFGANLTREGILPLAVVISNNGEHPIAVRPSDVLLHRGTQIIDPLPLEIVVAMAKAQHWLLRSKTRTQVDKYFDGLTFKEVVLSSGESYQGVMFFSIPRPRRTADDLFSILSLFHESGMRVRVGARDLDTRNRLQFGPFSLSYADSVFD